MGYRPRYIFGFDSPEGKQIEIVIGDDSFDGEAETRPLGGAPVLRMDTSDNVNGMSLEIPAECDVEDEYADLYTTDPTRFLVTLYINDHEAWQGFITPELYAAPWIDPPYDVALTATDGLGELKRYTYEARGRRTLEDHLIFLLAKTGLDLPLRYVSKLRHENTTDGYFYIDTAVSMDNMAGETCYDVLQSILTSIHATIRQHDGRWLVLRETDILDSIDGTTVRDNMGGRLDIIPFGSMRSNDVWPVGRLTSEIVPARNAVKINAPNYPSDNLLPDGDMSAGGWVTDGRYEQAQRRYWLGPSRYMSCYAVLPPMIEGSTAPDLSLSVSASITDTDEAHDVKMRVGVYGKMMGSSSMTTYYLGESDNGPYWDNATVRYVSRELPPAAKARVPVRDPQEVKVDIPFQLLKDNLLDTISSIEVRIEADDAGVIVYAASLVSVVPFEGVETTVSMNNGARGAAGDVDVAFADTYGYYMGMSWLSNSLWYPHSSLIFLVETLASSRVAPSKTGVFLALDNALSVATPRLSVKGVLHLPMWEKPPVFMSTGGMDFIVTEFSYDLKEDEMDLTLVSAPAVSLQVASIKQRKIGSETYSEESSDIMVYPVAVNFPAGGGTADLQITCASGYAWEVTGLPNYLTASPASGQGSGAVTLTCAANSGGSRDATISVGSAAVLVTQDQDDTLHLTISTNVTSPTISLTIDGVSTPYVSGMEVESGAQVSVTVSKTGYNTVGDTFAMSAANQSKYYELTEIIWATFSTPETITSAAQNVPITISDPQNHGWNIDADMAMNYNRVTAIGVTSGDATVYGHFIVGEGDAVVYLTIPACTDNYGRWIADSDAAIYFWDVVQGAGSRSNVYLYQNGVREDMTLVTSVTLNRNTLSLAPGGTSTLTATVTPSNATDKSLTWSSSNTSVATVTQAGKVTAVGTGTCTIRATANDGSGKYGSCAVTVTSSTVHVSGVSLDRESTTMSAGDTKQLTATVYPANATNKAVTWSSSNTSVATVSSSGLVTAVAAGLATITVTTADGGHTDTCGVTVRETPAPSEPGTISVNDISVVGAATSAAGTVSTERIQLSTLAASTPALWVYQCYIDMSGVTPAVRLLFYGNGTQASRTATVTVSGKDSSGNTITDTFTLTQAGSSSSDVPCTAMEIVGDGGIANSDNEAEYTIAFTPEGTTQKQVTWSLTDSNGQDVSDKVTLTPDGLSCALTITDHTVANLGLILRAVNTYNNSVSATKSITATYVTPPDAIQVSPGSVTVAWDATSDTTPQLTLGSGITKSDLVVTKSGMISSAAVSNTLRVLTTFAANTGSTDKSGTVTISYTDPTTQTTVSVVISYYQPYEEKGKDLWMSAIALNVQESGGTVTARFRVTFRNDKTVNYTFKSLGYTLSGVDGNGDPTFATRTGALNEKTVAALSTEGEVYTVTWQGSVAGTTLYTLTVRNGTQLSSTLESDGNDFI